MKRFFSFLGIAALALSIAACGEKEPKPIDVNDITEDGFYVVGDATGLSKPTAAQTMAIGINEAASQATRDGMYEKYIVLQGGKEFTLAYVKGGEQTAYGATLTEFKADTSTELYTDNPAEAVFKGALVVGDSAPKMKVDKTGLYHIVLDLNNAGDLAEAQIVLCPVTMGVRGGMNSWGFTPLEATEASNDGITFTLTGQEMAGGAEFKFAYNNAWKITLDGEGKVKANTNLGKDCKPGGDNIAVTEGAGKYKITLTYKLAAGDIANSFKYNVELEEASAAPETMYMIGNQFGEWKWESDGVVELAGIPNAPGYFWTTRYFNKADGFKFCATRAWNGDFTGAGTVGYTISEGNCFVAEDGFYTVFVNGNESAVEIYPAEVYGIGDAWGANAWDFNAPDIVRFVADGKTLKATVTNNSEGVRISSKIVPSAPIEGLCTPNGWLDWWKTEFVFFDGKIAYRGAGGDQARVPVTAGQEIILDFNNGTAEVKAGTVTPPTPTKATIKDFAQEYVKILDIWEATTGPVKMHSSVDATENAHYVPADTKITVGGKEYNTADMFETALRSYLLTRGYDGNELEKYGPNSIDKITAPKSISETEVPETHGYEWGDSPFNETSGNGGHLVMGTAEKNEHCKVKVDILDNWAMRSLNYNHGKPVTNLCGYAAGQLDGYYGCFCSQRALITYAFFFKYMLDNNIDLGTNVTDDTIIRTELFGDESVETEAFKAEWLFSADAMAAYKDNFGGTAGVKDKNAGDGGMYVDSNVTPGGRITYVQVDKSSVDPNSNAMRIVGATGHPYVKGPWTGDYWLFTLSNGKEQPAGAKAHIKYITRVSKTGPKYWVAEYNDGEEWKPVNINEKEAASGIDYNVVMEADGNTNVTVEAEFTLVKATKEVQFRMRCVRMDQANGNDPIDAVNGGTCRIAGAEGTSPIFEIL